MEGGYLIHPLFPPSVVSQLRNASKSQGEGGGWLIKEDKIGRFLPFPLSHRFQLTAPTQTLKRLLARVAGRFTGKQRTKEEFLCSTR